MRFTVYSPLVCSSMKSQYTVGRRISLTQAQRQLRLAFEVAAHEPVLTGAYCQCGGAGIVHAGYFPTQNEGLSPVLEAPHFFANDNGTTRPEHCAPRFPVLAVIAAAERAGLFTGLVGTAQSLPRAQRCSLGAIRFFDAMAAARLAQMLAQ